MGRQKPCSICSSGLAAEVNDAIRRREKLRDIEARTAFSRSALSRHSNRCLPRESLRQHRESKKELNSYNSRLWVKMPGEAESRLIADVQPSPWWRKKPETIADIHIIIYALISASLKYPRAMPLHHRQAVLILALQNRSRAV